MPLTFRSTAPGLARMAADLAGASGIMDTILHIGAHRTATTSFQACLRANIAPLAAQGLQLWEPRVLRGGLFDGVASNTPTGMRRARGRVQLRLAKTGQSGARQLLVSEENVLGSVRANMRARTIYPAAGERMARHAALFDGEVTRIVLSIRAFDLYWASSLAYGVARGHTRPNQGCLEQIASAPRTWRHVIEDIACAVPGAELLVVPFERVAGQSRALLRIATGRVYGLANGDIWCNRAPSITDLTEELSLRGDRTALQTDGSRWQPFTPLQSALLREAYADDIAWLAAGADGLATLTEDYGPDQNGTVPHGALTRGHSHDRQDRRLA